MADLFTLWGKIAIDATVANETIDGTMEKVTTLNGTLQVIGNQAEKSMGSRSKFGSASVWLGNMFTKLSDGAFRLTKNIAQTGFAFDASMEGYQGQFKALLNDGGKAAQLVADLQNLAKVSPLGMEGLANNAVTLLNAGTGLEDIVPTLEMLGNLALGDTNKMNSIVRAYTQILSKGQLMAQEMYQLGDAGVPIREIMTLYGGAEYADGSWYQAKMSDPTYKIMAEDMVSAFQLATAEGGKWHNYMFQMMDTWNGQVDRLGEEGKETLGSLFNPFFEVAKSDVLPKITESLGNFGTWVSENQDVLGKMADAVGGFVTGGFDALITAFTWIAENGEAVKVGLSAIAVGLIAGAVAAHPFAAAITAVVAGLALLQTGGSRTKEALFTYSDEELATLQNYVDAVNAAKEAEQAYFFDEYSMADSAKNKAWLDTAASLKQAQAELDKIDGLESAYMNWLGTQGAEGAYLDVPIRPSEESAGEMQTAIEGYALEGEASINASPDSQALIQAALDSMSLEAGVTLKPKSFLGGIFGSLFNGSHADGLDRVPFDGYRAILHKDEAVLKASEAAVYRGEKKNQTGKRNGYEANNGQVVNVTQNIQAVPMTPSELAAQTKYALGMLRFSV